MRHALICLTCVFCVFIIYSDSSSGVPHPVSSAGSGASWSLDVAEGPVGSEGSSSGRNKGDGPVGGKGLFTFVRF